MTLEEAIANAEAQAIRDEKEAERKRKYGGKFYDDEVQACLICAEQHRQLAEWLKELVERRKQPKIVRCKDCIKGKYHNLAKSTICMLHPFNPVRVEPDGFCKWAERRTDENTV